MDLQLEIVAKGINLGFMKASFDNLFAVAGRLLPEAQIAHLGRLIRLLEKHLAQRPNYKGSPSTQSRPSGTSSSILAATRPSLQISTSATKRSSDSAKTSVAAVEPIKKKLKIETLQLLEEFIRCAITFIRANPEDRATRELLLQHYQDFPLLLTMQRLPAMGRAGPLPQQRLVLPTPAAAHQMKLQGSLVMMMIWAGQMISTMTGSGVGVLVGCRLGSRRLTRRRVSYRLTGVHKEDTTKLWTRLPLWAQCGGSLK